jgi:hypothetical protein
MSKNTLERIIKHHFGVEPSGFKHMTFGHSSNEVYDVDLPEFQVILKIKTQKPWKALSKI